MSHVFENGNISIWNNFLTRISTYIIRVFSYIYFTHQYPIVFNSRYKSMVQFCTFYIVNWYCSLKPCYFCNWKIVRVFNTETFIMHWRLQLIVSCRLCLCSCIVHWYYFNSNKCSFKRLKNWNICYLA